LPIDFKAMPQRNEAPAWWSFPSFPLARLAVVVLLLLAPGACGPKTPQLPPLPEDGLVLAFGDSLTYGTGAAAQDSYPAVLERLIGRPVVRSGVPGEVSAKGLRRLAGVLERYRPDLLVLCHGGNDILRFNNDDKTAANLRAMVKLARSQGVEVVLIGVPKPGLFLSDGAGFYQRIARDFAIPYAGEILADILGSPSLKSDAIHPNAAGYRKLAEAVAVLLRKSGAI
jgi:lysophospholipase L1-like esterase